MRKLNEHGTLGYLRLEALPALQLHTINETLLPNLIYLNLWRVCGPFTPFIPLFLSPRTTSIFLSFSSNPQEVMVAPMVTTFPKFPKLCPNLQAIVFHSLPRNPMITAAVSEMLLATNPNTLQKFHVDSPLTEEASEVIYRLPNLCDLSVFIEGETSLPSASLPNLTSLVITSDNEGAWPQLFHGATFGKLKSAQFFPQSERIGNFLEAFERATPSSSIRNTLSEFHLSSSRSSNPNYPSLPPFAQLIDLAIKFPCDNGCSSRVDDQLVVNLSRLMPRLQVLRLGYDPCREFIIGVTAKGLAALALHCPNLRSLCVHFCVASLISPPASPGMTPNAEPTASWTDCALTELAVGEILVPKESALMVAQALLHIFPRIESVGFDDGGWEEVGDAIRLSNCSSKRHALTIC